MKKSLLVMALFGAAGFAQAASVTLYGHVDAGFLYSHVKNKTQKATNSFTFEDGIVKGSRIGVKGVEEIGDLKVGFKLENGFSLSNGKMSHPHRLFGREAALFVDGNFGTVTLGRFGGLGSQIGSQDVIGDLYAIGDSDGAMETGMVKTGRYDRAIAYKTPDVGGLQLHLMYANSNVAQEGHTEKFGNLTKGFARTKGYLDKKNEHYYGVGLSFNANKFAAGVTFEQERGPAGMIYINPVAPGGTSSSIFQPIARTKNTFVNAGASYDFDVVKLFSAYEFVKMADHPDFASTDKDHEKAEKLTKLEKNKLHVFSLGASAPMGDGKLSGQVSYSKFKEGRDKPTKLAFMSRYEYDLSKRTGLYVGAGVARLKEGPTKTTESQVYFGIGHSF